MCKELLTVIIPTYNGQEYLLATLQSVKLQNISLFRMIIIDDASIDESAEIAKKWSNNTSIKVDLILNHENIGLSETLNKAINKISTKYFMILAQDDILSIGYIESCLKLLEMKGGVAYTPSAKLIRDSTLDFFTSIRPQTKFEGGLKLFVSLLGGNQFVAPGSIYLKSAVNTLRFETCNVMTQDWEMWMQLSLRGEIISSKYFIYYRDHANNLHKKESSTHLEFDLMLALERVLNSNQFTKLITELDTNQKLALDRAIHFSFLNLINFGKFPIAFIKKSEFYNLELPLTNALINEICGYLSAPELDFLRKLNSKKPNSLEDRNILVNEFVVLQTGVNNEKFLHYTRAIQRQEKNKFNIIILLAQLFNLFSKSLSQNTGKTFYKCTVERLMRKYRDRSIDLLLRNFGSNPPIKT